MKMEETMIIRDIDDYPIESGRYLIEASAGTGKTYTITHLVLRLVRAGVPVRRILVTTFSRAAADELKTRILELLNEELDKLVPKEEQNTGSGPGAAPEAASASPSAREMKDLIRLKLAVSSIDEMTVSTIHGFCQKMLREFTLRSGKRFESEVIQNENEYTDRLAQEFCRRRFYGGEPCSGAEYEKIRKAARFASDPIDRVIPADGPDLHYDAYCFVRDHLQAEKDRAGVLSSNDMIRDLDTALQADDDHGLAKMIRDRYRAVFVDEFQDTDRIQYRIFDKCFPQNDSNVLFYMIGDPKQAIYGFRGADIYTYLQAKKDLLTKTGTKPFTLTRNFRSSPDMIESVNLMFGDGNPEEGHNTDGVFLQDGIPFITIRNGKERHEFPDNPDGSLRLRHYLGTKGDCAGPIADDVVREIRYLLSVNCPMQVFVKRKNPDGTEENIPRDLRASDIAILVQSHREAADFVARLNREGIAASACKSGKIYKTDEAKVMLLLLRCFLHPDMRYVRGLMLSPFFRISCGDVIARPAWAETLLRHVADCGAIWSASGLPAAFLHFLDKPFPGDVSPRSRILSEFNGERMITNYIQLMELLYGEESEKHLLPEDVFGFLNRAINEEDDGADGASEDNPDQLRLDRDSASVQIMTMFAAKGLEFPVVFVPYPVKTDWNGTLKPEKEIALRFNSAAAGTDGGAPGAAAGTGHGIVLDFGMNAANQDIARKEAMRNNLRLLYVALTRASLVTYLYTQQLGEPPRSSRTVNFTNSAQGVLLMSHERTPAAPGAEGSASPGETFVERKWKEGYFSGSPDFLPQPPAAWWTKLDEPENGPDQAFHVRQDGVFARHYGIRRDIGALRPDDAPERLETAAFGGKILDDWRIMSFSSFHNLLTGRTDEEQETPADLDERNDALAETAEPEEDGAAQDILSADGNKFRDFPRGTTVGTITHKVLENSAGCFKTLTAGRPDDPADTEALRNKIADVFREYDFDPDDETLTDQLVDCIFRTLRISLPKDAEGNGIGTSLSGVDQKNMVPEMEFFLSAPDSLDIKQIMDTLGKFASRQARRLIAAGKSVPDRKGDSAKKGILNGVIDLVFEYDGKYYIVDWKTNWLGASDADYAPDRVRTAMGNAGYILQSYLYSAALLGMLRQRHMDYSAFGGVYYLFLRGLKRETKNGIWFDKPPRECLENLLKLFRKENENEF